MKKAGDTQGEKRRNPYEACPVLENENFLLRLVTKEDAKDLLRVYSDEKAVPLFNSDNCNGDDFHYSTPERMEQAVDFWLYSYRERYFVRWAVVDKKSGEAVGTVELFHRISEDDFHDFAILRLDVRSDYEKKSRIVEILSLILPETAELFDCKMAATKAFPHGRERLAALSELGFLPTEKKLIGGHDGHAYGDYMTIALE
ncbi:MAG: GNAT family N-acetyltransferase [Roseburia sp.]|nr:GNAT family N-acetyltransferase [Roseburia sp.]